jgi:hypothetical protein
MKIPKQMIKEWCETYEEAIEKMVALNSLMGDSQKKYTTFFVVEKYYPTDK